MRWKLVVGGLAAFVAGCVSPANQQQCDDGRICPAAQACDTAHHICVDPGQLASCEGVANREPCMIGDTPGTCQDGTCLPSGCGNGRLDLVTDEVCDDGNNADGDHCSANCQSDESCGNKTIDLVGAETCDDGNHLDHDGCSSACESEQATWVRFPAPSSLTGARAVFDTDRDRVVVFGGKASTGFSTSAVSEWNGMWRWDVPTDIGPLARYQDLSSSNPTAEFALAYDADLRMTILTGGALIDDGTREMWGWDGARWHQLPNMPVALEGHAMAYDARRKHLVVFGGRRSISAPPEAVTYEFDGQAWAEITPAMSPPARFDAQMVYDAKRGVIVMYAGDTGTGGTGEIWEYDGTKWERKPDSVTFVPLLYGATVAYDPASARTVIFGINGGQNADELYLWDGSTLEQVPMTGTVPSLRRGAVLVPDGTNRLMLYGGEDSAYPPNQVQTGKQWFFDAVARTWVQSDPEPPARVFHAMVEQRNAGSVLRFGGVSGVSGTPSSAGETWELTRRGWQLTTSTNPPGLIRPGLVYDSARREAVMFGGATSSTTGTNKTWTRPPGGTWSEHPVTGAWPSARWQHAMVYDAARKQTIVFGGRPVTGGSGTPTASDLMWIWDGTSWTQKTVTPMPPPRSGASLGYDPVHEVVVLYGGAEVNNVVADTWIWDGTSWTDVTATLEESPGVRTDAAFVWNPARQALTLGPLLNFNGVFDTWEWRMTSSTAGTWTRIAASDTPVLRAFGGAFSALDGSGIFLDNGVGFPSGNFDDRIELTWQGPRAGDSCQRPEDIDGDMLTMCADDGTPADPDCWRVCTPDCPPGTSCAADTARCGDDMCSGAETCRSCPMDCMCTPACGDLICDPGESCLGDCP